MINKIVAVGVDSDTESINQQSLDVIALLMKRLGQTELVLLSEEFDRLGNYELKGRALPDDAGIVFKLISK